MGLAGWLVLSLIILIMDQITKIAISQKLDLGESQAIFDFFNVVLVHNHGAAFSFLANQGGWQRWFLTMFSVVAGLLIFFLLNKSHKHTLFASGLSLLLGGALGNLIDRIWHGYVIDFLDFYIAGMHWPAFNIADMAITCGIGLLLLDEIVRVRKS
jgi:signal peptidase II